MKSQSNLTLSAIAMAAFFSYQFSFSALAHNEEKPAAQSERGVIGTTVLPMSIDWHLSFEQVKESQVAKPSDEQANRLTYESELFGTEFHQEFLFTEQGKLKNILFYHSINADSLTCVEQYKQIRKGMVSQFGETKLNELSINPLESIDRAKLCELTAIGEYKLFSEWPQANEKVSLVLDTWKGQAYIGLSYHPI
ncbi:hypothetical protein [Shewanella sp. UCD-KL12]|uniref:hypothetical protein n=1 Tax=Shewanella sp. UCD-KL12 TaxID=1917163 RepID=UPI0009707E35|nr:hypothetical protein [Shewanella sp. UCD-KL12]